MAAWLATGRYHPTITSITMAGRERPFTVGFQNSSPQMSRLLNYSKSTCHIWIADKWNISIRFRHKWLLIHFGEVWSVISNHWNCVKIFTQTSLRCELSSRTVSIGFTFHTLFRTTWQKSVNLMWCYYYCSFSKTYWCSTITFFVSHFLLKHTT